MTAARRPLRFPGGSLVGSVPLPSPAVAHRGHRTGQEGPQEVARSLPLRRSLSPLCAPLARRYAAPWASPPCRSLRAAAPHLPVSVVH